jgi:hypothetical protein
MKITLVVELIFYYIQMGICYCIRLTVNRQNNTDQGKPNKKTIVIDDC